MSPRARGLVAIGIAAVVFVVLTWFDTTVVKQAQTDSAASFTAGNVMWLIAAGLIAVAGGAILYAGLAWWSRSFLASLVFLVAGGAGILVSPLLFTFPGDWPYYLNLTLVWWLDTATGPVHAAAMLDAALVVSGVVGFYRWATTRRLALTDR